MTDLKRGHPATWRLVLDHDLACCWQQRARAGGHAVDSLLAGHFRPPLPEQQVSYQAAQTTANYLSWFISS